MLTAWALTGIGFFLPISTGLTNLMLLLFLIAWLLSGHWAEKWHALQHSPAALVCLAFFGLVLVGTQYGEKSADTQYALKYAVVLLVPLALSSGLRTREIWCSVAGFCGAMVLTLVLSYAIWFGLLPEGVFKNIGADNPVVFKLHITHSFFMALAACFLYFAASTQKGPRRYLLLGIAALAVINVLLMVKGRTGQITLLILGIYIFHCRFRRHGLWAGTLAALIVFSSLYFLSQPFKNRINIALTEAAQWETHKGDEKSSIGTRLDFYTNTYAIIRQHPLIGVGTEGFPHAYKQQVEGMPIPPTENPHNQYLLLAAQLGILGLLALLSLHFIFWSQARRLTAPFACIGGGVILAYLVGNLFNSLLIDFSERILFFWAMGCLLSAQPEESEMPVTRTKELP